MVVVISLGVYGNDYKFRIDMHNFFIYHPVAPKMEQRKELESSWASKSRSIAFLCTLAIMAKA